MKKTWIVVADASKAQAFRYQGPKTPLECVGELHHVNYPSRELGSDRPGRSFQSVGDRRAAMEPQTDPKEHEKHEFAREICAYLGERNSGIDELILIAPPKVLGDLRRFLPEALKHKITDELGKDLTNIPLQELPQHLQGVLNIDKNPMRDAWRETGTL